MRAYSEDLRLKVLDAVERGMPREEVARVFGISLPSIKRWLKRRRETGRVGPWAPPGPPAVKGAMLKEWLPSHLRSNPDLTLGEHREAFEDAFGVGVSTATVSRNISGLREGGGWPLKKKSPVASERDEEIRGLWRWLASRFDARRLVFIDESGFHTSMTRLRSRAPRGERAYGKVPRNRGRNQTLIASITLEGGMGEALSIEGATNAEVFEAYVERFLAPTLTAGQVVVLDGLGAHRTERVRDLIEKKGAELLFLPSYSPDLNPIEEAFSKMKNLVRKAGARTREALDEAICEAFSAVTFGDVAGWFSHCGYQPRDQYS